MFYGASTRLDPARGEPATRFRRSRPLCSTVDPEEKRRIIGDTFMRVANDMIDELKLKPQDVYLGQGKLLKLKPQDVYLGQGKLLSRRKVSCLRVANDMIDELKLKPQDVYLGQGELLVV